MKPLLATLMASLTLFTQTAPAAQTADVHLHSLSLKFNRATGPYGLFFLDLTGISSGINGELFPVSGSPWSHYSNLILTDESDMESSGSMYLDVPFVDNNFNGFNDCFESAMSFSGSSSGTFIFPGSYYGDVTATWSRSAGSYSGTCQLDFQYLGVFTHTFNIFEYTGPVTYSPGASNVSASVDLTLNGDSENKLSGPIDYTKEVSDPYNQMTNDIGGWTNSAQQTLSFSSELLYRDTDLKTNYYGIVFFDDWDLNSADVDYNIWEISIDDVNDANGNGVPDFSDDPQIVSVRSPNLGLATTSTNLQLTIRGDVGSVCEIQNTTSLNPPVWSVVSSVTLTNDPQTVSIPLSIGGTSFWRVRAN